MSLELKKNQIDRYSRQIILKNIGIIGQKKILTSRVLIVGAGGLGCPVAEFLARAGVGTIGIIDDDKVNLSNLHRQSLYDTNDLGKSKVKTVKACVLEEGQTPEVTYTISYEAPGVAFVTSPVLGSITAVSIGGTSKLNVPPTSPIIVVVPPSQVGVIIKEGSFSNITSNDCTLVDGQIPDVVYSIVYEAPEVPPVTSPVTGLIIWAFLLSNKFLTSKLKVSPVPLFLNRKMNELTKKWLKP